MNSTPRNNVWRDDDRPTQWKSDAACRDQDFHVYDTDDIVKPHPEIRCALCVVRPACLTYALNGRESGTWGGLSRKERERVQKRIGRKRKLRSCPMCQNAELIHYENPGTGCCPSCGFTWTYVETTYGARAVTVMDKPQPANSTTHVEA